jgi:ATP-binding cassette subfamily B multidrug efflux pump
MIMKAPETKSRPSFGFRGPGGRAKGPVEKAKNFKESLKTLLKELAIYKKSLIVVVILALVGTIFNIVGPKVMGKATTVIFVGLGASLKGVGTLDYLLIGKILTFTALLYAISSLAMFLQGFILSNISQKVSQSMRTRINGKLHRLSLSSFDKTTHGEILSRITNDIDTVSQNLNQGLMQVLVAIVTLAGVIVMMFSISVVMSVVTLLILPISMLFLTNIIKKSQKYFVSQQANLGKINGQVEETYSAHVVVKAFGAEDEVIKEFKETNEKLYESAWKSQFLSGLMMPVMQGIGDVAYVVIALLGSVLVAMGNLAIGDIQAFIQYIRNFMNPISRVAQVTNMLQSTVAAAERVYEFLAQEEELDNVTSCTLGRFKGEVEFKDVKFGYDENLPVIKDFSALIESGKRVAIVGPTGAGKTTLVKLLMRFYDLQGGSIKIDGNDITNFSRHDLRAHFGMVLQDAWLFGGTIRENIRYGRLDATDEEVVAAAKVAHVDHFIHTLSGGYDMIINEESSKISQGQRQLITIARAFLANPSILILDEATSNVDTRTEVLIQEAMENLMKDRTSFVIAHRLSTIRNADLILVLKEGDIVEQGTHQELLEKRGFYADLYAAQFEGGKELVS